MAPLATSSSEADEWTLVIAGLLAGGALVATMAITIILCACGGDDEKPRQKAQEQPKVSPKSAKEEVPKSQKSDAKSERYKKQSKAVDVKALAKRYKVTEVEMKAYVDRFKSIDANNDGCLTDAELVEAMAKMDQPISREQAVKFIKQYDKNGDGQMQLEEFVTMVSRRRKWSQPDAEKVALAAFKEFDKNGDGNISADELVHAMTEMGDPISKDEADEMIKMADKNKDGNISYEEFLQFWKAYALG